MRPKMSDTGRNLPLIFNSRSPFLCVLLDSPPAGRILSIEALLGIRGSVCAWMAQPSSTEIQGKGIVEQEFDGSWVADAGWS
jgi:hypothetical protein